MNRQSIDAPPDATELASLSDVGRMRSVNEDSCESFVRSDGARLLVVADGMGGHRGGATASREAVAAIGRAFHATRAEAPDRTLLRAIDEANAHVFALAQEDPELTGMGTTVVAVLVDGAGRSAVAHVGDSRCYRWRSGRLEPLTTDHSVVAEMLRRGVLTAEEATFHPRRNEILRSVGVLPAVETEVSPLELAPGDWILLCSDGLCGVVTDAEIELVLAGARSVADAARGLVELANEAGGPDNVTVQLLAVGADGGTARRSALGARPAASPSSGSSSFSPSPSPGRSHATAAGQSTGSLDPTGEAGSADRGRTDAASGDAPSADEGAERRSPGWPAWVALLALAAAAAAWLLAGR